MPIAAPIAVRIPLAALALAAGTALVAGCGVVFNTLSDGLVRDDAVVTEVRVTGSSGDLTVVRDDAVKGVDIRRKAVYRAVTPKESMRVDNGVVHLDTDCGPQCTASYEVRLPHREAGVKVLGEITSGDVTLRQVSDVDIRVTSGDIDVEGASGTVKVESTSGDIRLTDVAGDATVTATSGTVEARDLRGVTHVESTSGDVRLAVPGTADVTVRARSGTIEVRVPDRTVIVTATTSSGDRSVHVTDGPAGSHRLDLRADSGDITVDAA